MSSRILARGPAAPRRFTAAQTGAEAPVSIGGYRHHASLSTFTTSERVAAGSQPNEVNLRRQAHRRVERGIERGRAWGCDRCELHDQVPRHRRPDSRPPSGAVRRGQSRACGRTRRPAPRPSTRAGCPRRAEAVAGRLSQRTATTSSHEQGNWTVLEGVADAEHRATGPPTRR